MGIAVRRKSRSVRPQPFTPSRLVQTRCWPECTLVSNSVCVQTETRGGLCARRLDNLTAYKADKSGVTLPLRR